MLRRNLVALDTFKEHYHRVYLPRRRELQRHLKRIETKRTAASSHRPQPQEQAYRYNRWWVNNYHNFVHQYAYVEDPDVARERRRALPSAPTEESLWKKPHATFFMPFLPYIRVMETAKDPDIQYMKPVNIPRWKDYMNRDKPVVPRTWY